MIEKDKNQLKQAEQNIERNRPHEPQFLTRAGKLALQEREKQSALEANLEQQKREEEEQRERLKSFQEKLHETRETVARNMPPEYENTAKTESSNAIPLSEQFPPRLVSALTEIKNWKGELHNGSSKPLTDIIKSLESASNAEDAAMYFGEMVSYALDYLDKRKGWRITPSGRERKRNVKELIDAVSVYLPEAPKDYIEQVKDNLNDTNDLTDELPKKYETFYQDNILLFDTYLRGTDHLDEVYGPEADEDTVVQHEMPKIRILFSKQSATELSEEYAPAYKDTVDHETRHSKQQNHRSRLWQKKKNRERLEASAQREAHPFREKMTEQRFYALLDHYLKIDTDGLDFSTEQKLSENADRLEQMTWQHQQIILNLKQYEKSFEDMDSSVRELIYEKLRLISGITSYYRISKMIITDPIYSNHYNHELSLQPDKEDSKKKRQLSMLLQLRIQAESVLRSLCSDQQRLLTDATMNTVTKANKKEMIRVFEKGDYARFTNHMPLLQHIESSTELRQMEEVLSSLETIQHETKLSDEEALFEQEDFEYEEEQPEEIPLTPEMIQERESLLAIEQNMQNVRDISLNEPFTEQVPVVRDPDEKFLDTYGEQLKKADAELFSSFGELDSLQEITIEELMQKMPSWKHKQLLCEDMKEYYQKTIELLSKTDDDVYFSADEIARYENRIKEAEKIILQMDHFLERYQMLEDFTDAYSEAIAHSAYLNVVKKGFALPRSGAAAPSFYAEQLQATLRDITRYTPKEKEAIRLIITCLKKWDILNGETRTGAERFRDLYFKENEKEKTLPVEKQAEMANSLFNRYNDLMAEEFSQRAEKEKLPISVNSRKLSIQVSAMTLLKNLSMDEAYELYKKLSAGYHANSEDPKALREIARGMEEVFDQLLELDLDSIHVDQEHILENAKFTKIKLRIGMELDDFYTDYIKILNSGMVKDLAYDDKKLTEVKARLDMLTDLAPKIELRIELMKNPFIQTEEGQALLKMSVSDIEHWFPTHRKAPKELQAFASAVYNLRIQEVERSSETSISELLKESRKAVMKKASLSIVLFNKDRKVSLDNYGSFKETLSAKERRMEQEQEGTELNLRLQNAKTIRAKQKQRKEKKEEEPSLKRTGEELLRELEQIELIRTEYLDISSDQKIAATADRIEEINDALTHFLRIREENKAEYEKLPEERKKEFSLHEKALQSLVSYTRIRMAIIADPWYSTHLNREIGLSLLPSDTITQKRLLSLLILKQIFEAENSYLFNSFDLKQANPGTYFDKAKDLFDEQKAVYQRLMNGSEAWENI